MAKVHLNSALGNIRGTIDGLVFRRHRGGTVLQRKPRFTRPWTAGTQQTRERFAAADAYYKRVGADAELCARYRAAGKREKLNFRQRAMRDFYRPPKVTEVAAANYHPDTGGPIVISAWDDFEVVRVTVALRNEAGNIVAEGDATLRDGCWHFDAPAVPPPAGPLSIIATAYDRPGNTATHTRVVG